MPTKKTNNSVKKTGSRGRPAPTPKKKGEVPVREAEEQEKPASSQGERDERKENLEPIGVPVDTGGDED